MPETMTRTDRMMTTAEAAEYLGVRPQTLSVWRSNKRYPIPFIKVGQGVRYRKSDLDAWLESRTVKPQSE
jgi:excisionase family DNA binding protein